MAKKEKAEPISDDIFITIWEDWWFNRAKTRDEIKQVHLIARDRKWHPADVLFQLIRMGLTRGEF